MKPEEPNIFIFWDFQHEFFFTGSGATPPFLFCPGEVSGFGQKSLSGWIRAQLLVCMDLPFSTTPLIIPESFFYRCFGAFGLFFYPLV